MPLGTNIKRHISQWEFAACGRERLPVSTAKRKQKISARLSTGTLVVTCYDLLRYVRGCICPQISQSLPRRILRPKLHALCATFFGGSLVPCSRTKKANPPPPLPPCPSLAVDSLMVTLPPKTFMCCRAKMAPASVAALLDSSTHLMLTWSLQCSPFLG